jgi:diguanylate cyclase (GGDEF)-like protein
VLARTYKDQERLAILATRDPLTGLFNRRGFYGSLTQWCSLAQRYGHALGVLVVDVDNFKTVNDTYGHPAGDEVLIAIAKALSKAVRTADVVARNGGDEFAILAPDTSAEALRALAERVLSHVRDVGNVADAPGLSVTVSIGGAFLAEGEQTSPEALLTAADQSLYEAKHEGRNCAGIFANVGNKDAESE